MAWEVVLGRGMQGQDSSLSLFCADEEGPGRS